MKLEQLSTGKINEMSMIDLCYAYMQEKDIEKLNIYDFLDYIKPLSGISDDEFINQATYFYTDLNLDGRFVCVDDGSWMLKDKLLIEDIKNFVEPSIQKYEVDDEDIEEFEDEEEEILDEVDQLVEEEEGIEENEDVYDYDDEGIVSKFAINTEEEEF